MRYLRNEYPWLLLYLCRVSNYFVYKLTWLILLYSINRIDIARRNSFARDFSLSTCQRVNFDNQTKNPVDYFNCKTLSFDHNELFWEISEKGQSISIFFALQYILRVFAIYELADAHQMCFEFKYEYLGWFGGARCARGELFVLPPQSRHKYVSYLITH